MNKIHWELSWYVPSRRGLHGGNRDQILYKPKKLVSLIRLWLQTYNSGYIIINKISCTKRKPK